MNIPIKSFTCECGMMSTVPKEYNSIYDEFKTLQKIRKRKNVQVIDKETKFLRDMTPEEKKDHLISIERAIAEIVTDAQKQHKKNQIDGIVTESDNFLDYEIRRVPADAILKRDGDQVSFMCPLCNAVLYQVKF